MLISSAFLTDFVPPPLGPDANYFVVARTEAFGEGNGDGQPGWIEDRTRVTDSPVLAVAWALMLTGVADDGANPLPLARVRTFAVDPSEHADAELDDLPGERVVLYVEGDGTVVAAADEAFEALQAETSEWSEIIKLYAEDDDED